MMWVESDSIFLLEGEGRTEPALAEFISKEVFWVGADVFEGGCSEVLSLEELLLLFSFEEEESDRALVSGEEDASSS